MTPVSYYPVYLNKVTTKNFWSVNPLGGYHPFPLSGCGAVSLWLTTIYFSSLHCFRLCIFWAIQLWLFCCAVAYLNPILARLLVWGFDFKYWLLSYVCILLSSIWWNCIFRVSSYRCYIIRLPLLKACFDLHFFDYPMRPTVPFWIVFENVLIISVGHLF